ncbi:MAG: DUF1549 and DUF1553 domain-containing protein [Bryobacteraceae bacterium]
MRDVSQPGKLQQTLVYLEKVTTRYGLGAPMVPHDGKDYNVRQVRMEISPNLRFLVAASLAPFAVSLSAAEAIPKAAWAYTKPARITPPLTGSSWIRTPVDAFILARLQAAGIAPAPEAPPAVLARRLYFDLLGLPPTPAELEAFLDDRRPDAYDRLIERLLADSRYGERWGRHWLDLVRYGETSGLEGDGAIGNAWRYRDWVIQAFNADLPYDRFVTLQLAGADEHSQTRNNYQPDIQGHVPLGFLRVAPWDRSNLVAAEVRANYLAEVTATTGSVFLGLTIGCARCHDHKYDPIPQKDYYRFQSFFNTVQVENVDVPYADPAFAAKADSQVKHYQRLLDSGDDKKALEDLEKTLLAKLIPLKKTKAAGKPLDAADLRLELRRDSALLFSQQEKDRYASLLEDANRTLDAADKTLLLAYESQLLARLRDAYATSKPEPLSRFDLLNADDVRAELGKRESLFNEDEIQRHQALSQRLEVYRRRLGRWRSTALTVRNVPGPPNGPMLAPVRVLNRGDYRQPGEAVEPGFPNMLTGGEKPADLITDRYRQFPTRGWRLTLARWIASPSNPLTARVMANRVWQHHFGRGIVATPSDFGANGEKPSHPELLDWLAVEFMDRGWSVKDLHRVILRSNTYRQAADNPASAGADPDNKLLSHFNRQRLQAEAIRDSILASSGRLNPAMYGPSIFPELPADLADFARYGRSGGIMWEPNERDEDARRRSVYIFQRRSLPLPMMSSFDALPFAESCDRRSVTTTPLQALSMLNGNLVHEEAVHMAARLQREAGPDRRAQIKRAFEIALNRNPNPDELEKFAAFDGDLAAICRVLWNSNEFVYVD